MNLQNYLYENLREDLPGPGDLIISEPIMEDTFFGRSVCLIIDCPESGGHAGLLLNKPVDISLNQLLPGGIPGTEQRVFCGGPVDLERLSVLHTLGDRLGECYELKPGLYLGADLNKVIDYIEEGYPTEGKIRLFLGYCGWEEGQLENEISRHTWAVNKNRETTGLIEGEGLSFWRREVADMGTRLKTWLNIPPNPYCN